eukprot:s40_g5.t1
MLRIEGGRLSDIASHIWQDVRSLYEASAGLELSWNGVQPRKAFHVQLDGRQTRSGDDHLLSGCLLGSWLENSPEVVLPEQPQTVVVRLSHAVFLAVAQQASTLRILHARLMDAGHEAVIDTCDGVAVVAGDAVLRADEVVEVAELFSGGFCGWSQGVQVAKRFGIPTRIRWLLDTDPACIPGAQAIHPGLQVVQTSGEVHVAAASDAAVFLCASLEHVWWSQGLALKPPHCVCVSAPCQPWSGAANSHGLEELDGRLLLHTFAILACFRPPLILLEQVTGFQHHRHFQVVQQAWQDCGYRLVWACPIDLIDFAPCSRKRCLFVLAHTQQQVPALVTEWPAFGRRPSLGSFDCIVQAPLEMLEASVPSKEILDMYLDPWYFPTRHQRSLQPVAVQAHRLRTSKDQAACFMAQYHYQHELPESMLTRHGLFGCLLQSTLGPRFFTGAEIAILHCANCPIWLSRDDREQMRILGNSLSPAQAVFPLALAYQALGHAFSTAQFLLQCLSMRLKASQTRFVTFQEGWLFCSKGSEFEAVSGLVQWAPPQVRPLHGKCQHFAFQAPDETLHLVLAPDVPLPAALRRFGHNFPEEVSSQLCTEAVTGRADITAGPQQAEACLEVDALPALPLHDDPPQDGAQHLVVVIGNEVTYVLPSQSQWFLWGLSRVMDFEGWREADAFDSDFWVNLCGHQLQCREDFQGTLSFFCGAAPECWPEWCLALESLADFKVLDLAAPPRLQISGPRTLAICKGFPLLHFAALGWQVQLVPSVDDGHVRATILFGELPNRLRTTPHELWRACHKQVFRGLLTCLQQVALENGTQVTQVKFQWQGVSLWEGHLPGDLAFEDVETLWQQAGEPFPFALKVRVYSGPKPILPASTLAEACQGPCPPGFMSRGGRLLVSLMPETRGGGAKDFKFQTAQTNLAQYLLEKGWHLSAATQAVDTVLSSAGAAKVQRALDSADPQHRWSQVQSLCQQCQVNIPEAPTRSAKASQAVMQEAHRRFQRQTQRPAASSFQLAPGFFRNADNSPATVLKSLLPGTSGVCLVDASDGPRLLQAYAGSSPDELGLVILGHDCPEPATCQGSCGVPAHTSTGEQVILHACWHNLGQSPLHIHCENDITMAPPEAVCLCFTAFRDEFTNAAEWQALTTNPVRTVVERLRDSGVTISLEAPWGRSFRLDSKAAKPESCDTVQFHCRLPRSELLPVLRKSGHNNVYATPKSWRNEVLPGFSVLWATGGRDEAVAQSLQLPDQLGIVRSRQRYGIRLDESSFQAAWQKLKPGLDAPPKVAVNALYKLLSVPPDIRSKDLQEWAAKLKWTVRPLRSLGPREWLVGADGPPPQGLYSINQQAILIQKVEARQVARPVVRAGRLPRFSEESAASTEADPLQANDPWKNYLQGGSAKATNTIPPPAPAPRAPAAPVQARFDQQDERLQRLEAGLAEIQRGHKAMAQEVAGTQAKVDAQVQQVRAELGDFAKDFATQLQANAESQRQAQAQQQMQLQLGLQEIKSLLQSSPRRTGASAKRSTETRNGSPPRMELEDNL